jgi:hypothetical protein
VEDDDDDDDDDDDGDGDGDGDGPASQLVCHLMIPRAHTYSQGC